MNNQFNLTYETDLNQGLASTTLPMLFLYDDSLAHVFTVKTTRDGKPNSLTGSTVHAYFMPSNSEECVYIAGTVDENGYAVVTLEPACYAFIGRFSLVIRAEKGSAVTSIFRGEGYVGQSHTDAILDPGNALPSLAALEAKIDALTYADVGAAPDGYGLGGFAQSLNSSHDLNTVTGTGFYRWGGDRPANAPFGYAVMEHIQRGNDSAYQMVTMISGDTFYQTAVHRFMSETWGEWEYVNPPMAVGVEYRTTERWNGKPVYTVLTSCGALGASVTNVDTIIPTNATVIRHAETMGNMSLPYYYAANDITLRCDYNNGANGKVVVMYGVTDYSARNIMSQAWYVKP